MSLRNALRAGLVAAAVLSIPAFAHADPEVGPAVQGAPAACFTGQFALDMLKGVHKSPGQQVVEPKAFVERTLKNSPAQAFGALIGWSYFLNIGTVLIVNSGDPKSDLTIGLLLNKDGCVVDGDTGLASDSVQKFMNARGSRAQFDAAFQALNLEPLGPNPVGGQGI